MEQLKQISGAKNPIYKPKEGDLSAYKNVSTTVNVKGKKVKIHGLCTGSVAVKRNFKKKKGYGELAKLNILLDSDYTNYLPIWVWVIEHPEGLLVIDTGENTEVTNLDQYLAKESWFQRFQFKNAAKFSITENQALDQQFAKINLRLEDVKLVVLTHLHLDHTDGLKFFPKQEIIISHLEYKNAEFHMPSTYPNWFKPNKVNYQTNRVPVFDQAYPITASEDLVLIPTPGHTKGHSSVLFKTDDFDIIFAGDSSYNQDQLFLNEVAGVNKDYRKTRQTYHNLLTYAAENRTIYLPTHDEHAGHRLENKCLLQAINI